MNTVTDTNGHKWFVAGIISSDEPGNPSQITPGFCQVNIGQNLDSQGKPIPESGITLPIALAKRWIANEIRVKI
ncbi:MAG: hypothetical protein ACO23H_17405 [Alphaproteobacteria bacterium]